MKKPELAQDLVQNWQSPIRNRTTLPLSSQFQIWRLIAEMTPVAPVPLSLLFGGNPDFRKTFYHLFIACKSKGGGGGGGGGVISQDAQTICSFPELLLCLLRGGSTIFCHFENFENCPALPEETEFFAKFLVPFFVAFCGIGLFR